MSKFNTSQNTDNSNNISKIERELASFIALIVDATMQSYPTVFTETKIKCNKKGCDGIISTKLLVTNDKIAWKCSKCENNGIIKTGLNGIV